MKKNLFIWSVLMLSSGIISCSSVDHIEPPYFFATSASRDVNPLWIADVLSRFDEPVLDARNAPFARVIVVPHSSSAFLIRAHLGDVRPILVVKRAASSDLRKRWDVASRTLDLDPPAAASLLQTLAAARSDLGRSTLELNLDNSVVVVDALDVDGSPTRTVSLSPLTPAVDALVAELVDRGAASGFF